MKVIDLYNKIAKDEKIPYKIKYNKRIYEYAEEIKWYLRDDMKCELSNSKKCLNDEVEILEEPKGIPEKLEYFKSEEELYNMSKILLFNNFVDKINEIIDCLEYLESKGE